MEIWYAQSIKISLFILHPSFRCLFGKKLTDLKEINSTEEDEVHHSCLNEATSLTWGKRKYRAEGKVPTKKLYIEVKCVIISFAPCVRKTMTILTWDMLYNFVWRARRAGASVKSSIKTDYSQLVAQWRIRTQECGDVMARNRSETLSETCRERPVYVQLTWYRISWYPYY